MFRPKNFILSILLTGCFCSSAQQLNLLIRQPLHLVSSAYNAIENSTFKDYRINLAAEYIPEKSQNSISLNLAYAYVITPYPSFYYRPQDRIGDFFKECYTFGGLGRHYMGEGTTKFFAELGMHLHYLRQSEAIVIRTNYGGRYEEYSKSAEFIFSSSLGLGLSATLFWNIRIEPNIQFILVSNPADQIRQERVFIATGSEGLLQGLRNELNQSEAPFNQYLFLSFSLKVPLLAVD